MHTPRSYLMLGATAALVLAPVALSGCATVTAFVTTGYNELCVDTPAQPSLLTAAKAAPLNAQRQKDIATLSGMCANGVPTNAFAVAADGLSAYALLQRDFPSLKLK